MEKPTSQSAANGAESAQVRDRGDRVRRRLRWRWWCGWGLVVVGLVLGIVFLVSGWWTIAYVTESFGVGVDQGLAGIVTGKGDSPGVHIEQHRSFGTPRLDWFLTHARREFGSSTMPVDLGVVVEINDRSFGGQTHLWITVIWPWSLLSLAGGLWLMMPVWRERRRARAHLCRKCGYDLTGLTASSPCPECGTARVVESKA